MFEKISEVFSNNVNDLYEEFHSYFTEKRKEYYFSNPSTAAVFVKNFIDYFQKKMLI